MNKEIINKLAEDEIQYMDIKEFRAKGFLQEANRLFFHPLGLALEVVIKEDGTEHLGGIWDYRDDPEGMLFNPGMIDKEKILNIRQERDKHIPARLKLMYSFIQYADTVFKEGEE